MTVSTPTSTPSGTVNGEIVAFKRLNAQLKQFWAELQANPRTEYTSVIVPSLSVNQEELAKVQGAGFYEERLLFSLIRLRNPNARAIYVTSQPIHPDTIDYYLQLLVGVPASHAKRRLLLLCVQDASSKPLTQKILERPRVIERLKGWIGDPRRAYLTCYNTTGLERTLAVKLGIPLNGTDPGLLWLGTKSGSRKVFRDAEVPLPAGFEDVQSADDAADALVELRAQRPGVERALVKLNEGFAGEGNAVFRYPDPFPDDRAAARRAVADALTRLEWAHAAETYEAFFRKFAAMGGVVEEFVRGTDLQSPSAQLRIQPDGDVRLISTHDQVIGGATNLTYLGCRFPAHHEYRTTIQTDGYRIGRVLAGYGVIGRFGVDFLVTRDERGAWQSQAVEINLRMGGTTPPYMALEFLARGAFDVMRGTYLGTGGREKFYYATDNLRSADYRGLLPEDLLDILAEYGIRYDPGTATGVLFYMIGALSQFGKLGVVSIGNSREEADELYLHTVKILDQETDADESAEHLHPLFDHSPAAME